MKKERILSFMMLTLLLGTRNGYIALWKAGEPEPIRTFPYMVQFIPEPDRRALEKGILIESPGQLAQLLEDYLS